MIGNAILDLLILLMQGLQTVVPTVDTSSLQSALTGVQGDVFQWLSVLSPVVDVPVVMSVVYVLMALLSAGMIFRLANYVFNHIPFVGAFG